MNRIESEWPIRIKSLSFAGPNYNTISCHDQSVCLVVCSYTCLRKVSAFTPVSSLDLFRISALVVSVVHRIIIQPTLVNDRSLAHHYLSFVLITCPQCAVKNYFG